MTRDARAPANNALHLTVGGVPGAAPPASERERSADLKGKRGDQARRSIFVDCEPRGALALAHAVFRDPPFASAVGKSGGGR